MRKANSILLLLSFLLMQYSRHVSYLQCQAVNYLAVSSTACDCMKVFTTEKEPADNKEPLPVHTHIHPEEHFCAVTMDSLKMAVIYLPSLKYSDVCFKLTPGFIDEPARPPQVS